MKVTQTWGAGPSGSTSLPPRLQQPTKTPQSIPCKESWRCCGWLFVYETNINQHKPTIFVRIQLGYTGYIRDIMQIRIWVSLEMGNTSNSNRGYTIFLNTPRSLGIQQSYLVVPQFTHSQHQDNHISGLDVKLHNPQLVGSAVTQHNCLA